MVARRQRLKHRQAGRHARAEGNRLDATLQIGQALFQRIAIGIVDPAVEVMPGELAISITLKGGGSVERRSDRASGRVNMPAGVDAERLQLLVRIGRRCHSLSLLRRQCYRIDAVSFWRQLYEAYSYLKDCAFNGRCHTCPGRGKANWQLPGCSRASIRSRKPCCPAIEQL